MKCFPDRLLKVVAVIGCLGCSSTFAGDEAVQVEVVGQASRRPVKVIDYEELFPVLQKFDQLHGLYPQGILKFHFKPTNASAPRLQIYYAAGDEIRAVPTDAEGAFDLPLDPALARAHTIVYTNLPIDYKADFEFGWEVSRPDPQADATMGYYRLLCAVTESYVAHFANFAARALVGLQGGLCRPFKLKTTAEVAGATVSWDGNSRLVSVGPPGILAMPLQDTDIPDAATVHRVLKKVP
jgi:hypothetical protein